MPYRQAARRNPLRVQEMAAEITAQVAADPGLARRAAKLMSVEGVGPVFATTLCGKCRGGRKQVRDVAYMATNKDA